MYAARNRPIRKDVEQDIRINRGNHRPRTSSMKLSTEEWPK